MKNILLFLAVGTSVFFTDVTMLGITIGSPESALEKLKLEEVAVIPASMVKYRTANGNDFSVTTENGKVVLMENDWLQDPTAKEALLPGFTFGETTLADIRKRFGSNGFTHKNSSIIPGDGFAILFNCYEFDSPNEEILVCITKVTVTDDLTEENVAKNAKLDALIVASKSYLDQNWGSEKLYDPNNKKIKL